MYKINKYIDRIRKYKKTLSLAVLVGDALFLLFSNPASIAPELMILAFVLVYATIYMVCHFIATFLIWMGAISSIRRWALIAISGAAFILVMLQTFGQLSLRDIAVLVPLLIVAYFYFTRVARNNASY